MKKLLSIIALGLLVFMFTGCGEEEVAEVEVVDELFATGDEDVEDEIIYIDPAEEVGTPTEIPEEIEEPTTGPPTGDEEAEEEVTE